MLGYKDMQELLEAEKYNQVVQALRDIRIKTDRKDSIQRLKSNLRTVIDNKIKTPQEKTYDLFVAIAAEHQKIIKSFGGSNSQMARDLQTFCTEHFGLSLGKDSYKPDENGFVARFLKSAKNTLKMIFEFDTSNKKDMGGATNSACVEDINGKSSQLKPSILDNPSLMRKIKAGFTDRENFGEVIAARIGRHLLSLDKVPEVSLVYDPIRARMSIASKYIEGSVGNLNNYADVKKNEAKRVVYVKATKKPLQKGERSIDSLDKHPELKQDLARAIVLSAVVGDHDVNPGNMIVAAQDGTMRMCRIDFGHAFNDLLNASEFNGGQVRDKANPILDFFNRSEVGGIGGAESKLWRSYPGFIPSQEIVNALREMAGNFNENAAKGVEEAKGEFRRAFAEMEKFDDKEGIQHMKDSLNAICENISGEKVIIAKNNEAFLEHIFSNIETFIKTNGANLNKVADTMQLQLNIDKALIDGQPLKHDKDKNAKIEWVKTGSEPAFVGTVGDYLLHRANQLKLDKTLPIRANYDRLVEKNPNLLPPKKMNRTEEYRLRMFGIREPKKSAEPTENEKINSPIVPK